jgi:glycosyltransferase involved in cell wall biosynthesis
LGERLIVIGEGELLSKLRKRARPNIEFLGRQPFESIRDHYARCRALVFPGIEDFGIVPVEAMAAGKPVIAFAGGGVLETVVDGVTGILFTEQTQKGLVAAVREHGVRERDFVAGTIRKHAEQFTVQRFKSEFSAFIARALAEERSNDG